MGRDHAIAYFAKLLRREQLTTALQRARHRRRRETARAAFHVGAGTTHPV
jgi:hypothetical protein